MTEWLILVLLVPAIVVPVVLLVGFAGCDLVFRLDRLAAQPVIVSAVGKSVSAITLTWTYADHASVEVYEFERTQLPEQTTEIIQATSSPFDDTSGLKPATDYLYRVRAIFSDGESSDWSEAVPAATLSFETTFEAQLPLNDLGWEGRCLVQRIEPTHLSRSGTQVRLTVRASTSTKASIERLYISQPASAGDPYDSAADLTPVITAKRVVQANNAVRLGPVEYHLDHTQPLLIAVDFTPGTPSGIRYREVVPPEEHAAYRHTAPEAELPNRADNAYQKLARIYLVTRVDVG